MQTYCTAIRITFKDSAEKVEGAGLADANFPPSNLADKCSKIRTAQKKSRNAAVQNAFAKILLIVLDGGRKVSIGIDGTKLDPFHFDPLWEEYEAKVCEANYEVESQEDEF